MKKTFKSILAAVCLLVVFAMPASALEITPRLFTGRTYAPTSTSTNNKNITWRHTHKNTSSSADSVTRTVSRTKYFNGSVEVRADADAMVAKVGYSAEVSYGTSATASTSVTYSIPAKTTYECQYGSIYVKTSGLSTQWAQGKKIRTYGVNGNWTRQGYSTKVKK